MFNFFYDSLETLKQVKKPTKQEVIDMTIKIFVIVIIAGIFFAISDGIFYFVFQQFYNLMK